MPPRLLFPKILVGVVDAFERRGLCVDDLAKGVDLPALERGLGVVVEAVKRLRLGRGELLDAPNRKGEGLLAVEVPVLRVTP